MSAGSCSDSIATSFKAIAPPTSAPLRIRDGLISGDKRRIESLDAARLIAILAIITLHAGESPTILRINILGTFGVPFYLFAAIYFQARSFKRDPIRNIVEYITARVWRLYIPMLAWTSIYILAREAKHFLLKHDGPVAGGWWFYWAGSAQHLWYLPFLMVVTIFSGVLTRFCSGNSISRWTIIFTCGLIGTFLAIVPRPSWIPNFGTDSQIFNFQCWKALPSAFLAVSLAWWMIWEDGNQFLTPAVGIAGAMLTVAAVVDQIVHGYSRAERTLSGLGWFFAALAPWRGAWIHWLAKLGRHSYGIYLVHVLISEGVQAVAHKEGFHATFGLDCFVITTTFIVSAIIAVTISNTPKLKWLNGD